MSTEFKDLEPRENVISKSRRSRVKQSESDSLLESKSNLSSEAKKAVEELGNQMGQGGCPLTGGACNGCGKCTGKVIDEIRKAIGQGEAINPETWKKLNEEFPVFSKEISKLAKGNFDGYEKVLEKINQAQLISEQRVLDGDLNDLRQKIKGGEIKQTELLDRVQALNSRIYQIDPKNLTPEAARQVDLINKELKTLGLDSKVNINAAVNREAPVPLVNNNQQKQEVVNNETVTDRRIDSKILEKDSLLKPEVKASEVIKENPSYLKSSVVDVVFKQEVRQSESNIEKQTEVKLTAVDHSLKQEPSNLVLNSNKTSETKALNYIVINDEQIKQERALERHPDTRTNLNQRNEVATEKLALTNIQLKAVARSSPIPQIRINTGEVGRIISDNTKLQALPIRVVSKEVIPVNARIDPSMINARKRVRRPEEYGKKEQEVAISSRRIREFGNRQDSPQIFLRSKQYLNNSDPQVITNRISKISELKEVRFRTSDQLKESREGSKQLKDLLARVGPSVSLFELKQLFNQEKILLDRIANLQRILRSNLAVERQELLKTVNQILKNPKILPLTPISELRVLLRGRLLEIKSDISQLRKKLDIISQAMEKTLDPNKSLLQQKELVSKAIEKLLSERKQLRKGLEEIKKQEFKQDYKLATKDLINRISQTVTQLRYAPEYRQIMQLRAAIIIARTEVKSLIKELLNFKSQSSLSEIKQLLTKRLELITKILESKFKVDGSNSNTDARLRRLQQIQLMLNEDQEISSRMLQELIEVLDEEMEASRASLSRRRSLVRSSRKKSSKKQMKGFGLSLETENKAKDQKSKSRQPQVAAGTRVNKNTKTGNIVVAAHKVPSSTLDVVQSKEDDGEKNEYWKSVNKL